MTTGASFNREDSKQDYATPWSLIRACEKRFGYIGMDLAASDDNSKAFKHLSVKQDSLKQNWAEFRGEICWLNPPFSNIAPWAEKCSLSGMRILFLTPASVGSNWFRDHIHNKALVLALNGRITFVGAKDPYPKDCMISAFNFDSIGFEVWSWNK